MQFSIPLTWIHYAPTVISWNSQVVAQDLTFSTQITIFGRLLWLELQLKIWIVKLNLPLPEFVSSRLSLRISTMAL